MPVSLTLYLISIISYVTRKFPRKFVQIFDPDCFPSWIIWSRFEIAKVNISFWCINNNEGTVFPQSQSFKAWRLSRRLKEGGAYFKIREIIQMKFQNFVKWYTASCISQLLVIFIFFLFVYLAHMHFNPIKPGRGGNFCPQQT